MQNSNFIAKIRKPYLTNAYPYKFGLYNKIRTDKTY